jgi:hypothetical protein
MTEPDYRTLLFQFIASLTLADHMGDVAEDIDYVLDEVGFIDVWNDLDELGAILAKQNITTLYGSTLE